MLVVTLVTFFVAYVKCGLYEINKNNRANATRGPKMLRDRTEVMMDRRLRDPRPGSVLILRVGCHLMLNLTAKLISNVRCTGSSLKKNWKQTYCQLKRINCQVAKKSKKKISFMLTFFSGNDFLWLMNTLIMWLVFVIARFISILDSWSLTVFKSRLKTLTVTWSLLPPPLKLCRFICLLCVYFCFILHMCCIIVSLVGWTWWYCWLGHLTRKNPSSMWPIMCLVGR